MFMLHPQSNGQAEHFVDTFKRALLKLKRERITTEILQTFLLSYRTTPNGAVKNGMSLAEALMGWKRYITLHALGSCKQQQKQDTCNDKGQIFTVGFAQNFRFGQPNWAPGTISKEKESLFTMFKLVSNSRHCIKTNYIPDTPVTT